MSKESNQVPNMMQMQMHPQMLRQLQNIPRQQLPGFLFMNQELVSENYKKRFTKTGKTIFNYCILGFCGGIALNYGIKKFYLNFLKLPLYVRIPVRLFLFAVPLGGLYFTKIQKEVMIMSQNLEEIYQKIKKLGKTGNIQQYFREN